MDLVGFHGPLNTISHVEPKFVGKKGDDLPGLVLALCADSGLPLRAECRGERKAVRKQMR